ncbi:MAG: toll/interleukin-1 receptor domain-containing protein [Candidatus Rokubacteria bacterium]|nr:toll/interleukin-1 receptor domain-containing protein [Candidatus Rokubacteria bacterium]MBI2553130.1 toll/interleukin-1 receptor domain-containing protein [Candidatus Rokubacteria bacterium]
MPSVFLSHSHGDKPFVRDLAGRLTQAGATVWLDEAELGVGDSLIERISAAIEETDYMVAILSPRSVQSTWVQKELNVAMTKEVKGRRVTVLPVLIEACDVPHFLRDKLYADFTSPENHEREFAKLLKTIGLAPAPAYTTAAPTAASRGAEDVVYLVRRSLADQVADRHRERKADKFALVQADHGIREYSLQEVDRLTETQRTKLFAADPEMESMVAGKISNEWRVATLQGEGRNLACQRADRPDTGGGPSRALGRDSRSARLVS